MALSNRCVRVPNYCVHSLAIACVPLKTPRRSYRYNKKGGLKPGRNKIPFDWRKVDHNPAKIPSSWIPDSWYKENSIDYEKEKEIAKFIPGYVAKIPEHEDPNYHSTPMYRFTNDTQLVEGLRQAACLTKSVVIESFPEQIETLFAHVSMPNRDERVVQVFRHALLFDIDPVNLDKENKTYRYKLDHYNIYPGINRYCPTILQNMARLGQSLSQTYPKLLSRLRSDRIKTDATFTRGCDLKHGPDHLESKWKVQIAGAGHTQILSAEPLECFAKADEVKDTETKKLPDIYPVFPIVDLKKVNVYEDKTETGIPQDFSPSHLHTLLIANTRGYSAEETYAHMILQLFACLYSRAVELYGDAPLELPTPICGQCIATDGQNYQFLCMQLNTTNLQNDLGVKNMIWINEENHDEEDALEASPYGRKVYSWSPMYSACSHRVWKSPDYFMDYDPRVFQTFLSLWLNGAT